MDNYLKQLEHILQQNIRELDLDIGRDFHSYDVVDDFDKLKNDLLKLLLSINKEKICENDL